MGGGLLFGYKHHIRESGAQPVRDDLVRGFVGDGHGAFVRFGFDLEIIRAVNLHDLVARFDRQTAHHRYQLFIIHNVATFSVSLITLRKPLMIAC